MFHVKIAHRRVRQHSGKRIALAKLILDSGQRLEQWFRRTGMPVRKNISAEVEIFVEPFFHEPELDGGR